MNARSSRKSVTEQGRERERRRLAKFLRFSTPIKSARVTWRRFRSDAAAESPSVKTRRDENNGENKERREGKEKQT